MSLLAFFSLLFFLSAAVWVSLGWLKIQEKYLYLQALGNAWQKRVVFLLWLCSIPTAVSFIFDYNAYNHLAQKLFIIAASAYLLIAWKREVEKKLFSSEGYEKRLIAVTSRLISITVVTIALLTALDTMEIPITVLLAFGGLGGLAVGLAANETLSNLFAGITLLINRPFHLEDWIRGKGFEGYVEEIGWMMTRIRTRDRRPTYIPNRTLASTIVENPGRMYNRCFHAILKIRGIKMEDVTDVTEAIGEMFKKVDSVDHACHSFANLVALSADQVHIEVLAYTVATSSSEFRREQEALLLNIDQIIKSFGATWALPVQRLIYSPCFKI